VSNNKAYEVKPSLALFIFDTPVIKARVEDQNRVKIDEM